MVLLSWISQGLGHLYCHVPCAIGVSLFQFYGYLSQQQNMMQDYVRTGTYQRAILQNHTDFKDKVSRICSASLLLHTLLSAQCHLTMAVAFLFSACRFYLKFFLDYKSKIYFL